jgi:purine nucleosidase
MRSWSARFIASRLLWVSFAAAQASHAAQPSTNAAWTNNGEKAAPPVSVIFDTDIYSDIDDMLALAMLNTLQDRGEVKVLAVTVGTEAQWTAPYVDLVDTFYGHDGIPVGMVSRGISDETFKHKPFDGPQPYSPNGVNYTQYIAQLTTPNGTLVYPHKLVDGRKAEEAVHLLRRVLAAQPDNSVVVISVGYPTNLARLLDSKPDEMSQQDGRALVRRKVKLLSLMGGSFEAVDNIPAGDPRLEFNLSMDLPAGRKIFAEWPTPIVASGCEIGVKMLFPQTSIDHYFSYVVHHPIAETYNYVAPYYRKASEHPDAPHDHATFDLTSVLYAARPNDGYFSISKPGKITVLPNGGTRFEASEGGFHRYLILTDAQKARTLEAMVMLASQPPVGRNP